MKKRLLSIIAAFSFAINTVPVVFADANAENTQTTEADGEIDLSWLVFKSFTEPSYTEVLSKYTKPLYSGDDIIKELSLDLQTGDEKNIEIEVPQDGCYEIYFTYKNDKDQYLPSEMAVKIDEIYPFNEMRRLYFENNWLEHAVQLYDRYGNEMVSQPYSDELFHEKAFNDSSYRTTDPFLFEFTKGKHNLNVIMQDGISHISTITLKAKAVLPEYQYNKAEGNEIIAIEAEDISSKSSSGIHASGEYSTNLSPYSSSERLLNFLDDASFNTAGYRVTYNFPVKADGYYELTFDYRQSTKTDFPVFGNILIDGTVPFDAAMRIPFKYSTKFKKFTPVDENGNPITFYLTKGNHSISIVIDIENIREVFEEVELLFREINGLTTELVRLTGGVTTDKYRNYNLDEHLPGLKEILLEMADRCDAILDNMAQYSEAKRIGAFAPLEICSSMLRKLAKKHNDVPRRLGELSTGPSSVTKYLAQLMQDMGNNALGFDTIYIHQESAELPTDTGFLTTFVESIKRFFYSYGFQDYSVKSVDKTHLQVWMARPRQYVELLQNMADTSFTDKTGIKADISLMPDQSKLVLASAANKAPDVALSVGYVLPSYLSIRGALYDLKEFEDFQTVAQRFPEGLFLPGISEGGVYSLPETINFWVMFYRRDIFESLNLQIPDSLDEVKGILPELQRRSMNFYYPTAGMVGTKLFPATIPFLLQAGGSVFGSSIGNTTIDNEKSLAGFTELTDLFTIYDLPVDVPAPGFYQKFRSGELPIGIADISTYNLLLNSAPELAGLWDLALFPGIKDESGEIMRYTTGGAESDIIFKSTGNPTNAWQFLKWWSSDDVQASYGNTLTSTYGKTYLWNTANRSAFAKLPLQSSHKKVIIDQTYWMTEVPWVPGTYMVERELSNAYYSVVINGVTVRRAMDTAVKRINREIERKLEEFGFKKDGETIKEFPSPSTSVLWD